MSVSAFTAINCLQTVINSGNASMASRNSGLGLYSPRHHSTSDSYFERLERKREREQDKSEMRRYVKKEIDKAVGPSDGSPHLFFAEKVEKLRLEKLEEKSRREFEKRLIDTFLAVENDRLEKRIEARKKAEAERVVEAQTEQVKPAEENSVVTSVLILWAVIMGLIVLAGLLIIATSK